MKRAKAIRWIKRHKPEKEFEVQFIKRTTGELRLMKCRYGVTDYLQGGEPAYNFRQAGVICVFDVDKTEYRMIPIEGLTHVKIRGKWVQVED